MNRLAAILPASNVLVNVDATSKKRAFEHAGLLFENQHTIARATVSDNLFARGADHTPPSEIIRQAVRRADPRISASSPGPLVDRIENGVAMLRLTARLTVVFTVAAAMLTRHARLSVPCHSRRMARPRAMAAPTTTSGNVRTSAAPT